MTDPTAPDPVPEMTKGKRAKDPKKVAAGRAGAAARKAKMLEALRATKDSLRSSAVTPVGEASIPAKKAESKRNMQTNGSMFLLLRNNQNITVKDELTGPHGS